VDTTSVSGLRKNLSRLSEKGVILEY
jgi:hypothetical protein